MEDKLLAMLQWEKPTSRLSLSVRLGITERKVEELIAKLRDRGEPICSNSDTRGYWLSEGPDFRRTVKEIEHRGMVLIERARKMKEHKMLKGQVDVWNSGNSEQMK